LRAALERIERHLKGGPAAKSDVHEPIHPAQAAASRAAAPDGAPEAAAQIRTLKVDTAKVDDLLNLAGELVVSKNSLPFLARRAEEVYGSREMAREIRDRYSVIHRLAQEIQGAIMAVRMLPVSEIFDRYPRVVRDMARKLGKRIELTVDGGDTAADKTIIEAINDPLLHVLRNSIDHGLETPEQRIAAGKTPEGRLSLRAFRESDQVVIEIEDNGAGIDPVAVRAAAINKHVIDAESAALLSDQETINLIFRPGFSTAKAVTDLSGRGVGMDVVRTTVEKLGGSVALTSRVGEGTTIRMSLPLSMAVTRVMMVEAAGALYGVPMDVIVETVRLPRERIHAIKNDETFVLRDTVIPLARMTRLLRLPEVDRSETADSEAVLVCRVNGNPVGLVIDDFREDMDVVLKPLDGILTGIRGFAGTTLLGDGRVLLVLNLKELL
jgi:two-component system chemotaxis sensor kinase CheA